MPLSADNFVQENSGTTASGTSHVVTLPSGTTAGNTLVAVLYSTASGATPPSGWVAAKVQNTVMGVFYKSNVAAAESSWTFTTAGSVTTAWYVAEVSNVEPVLPVDASAGTTTTGMNTGSTASTGTTTLNAGLSTVAFAAFGAGGASGQTSSWSGYTNGFEEVADVADGSGAYTLGVARLFENSTTRTFESTATLATSGTGLTAQTVMAVFRAADSPIVAPLHLCAGFDWGTHGGIASQNAVTSMLGASVPTPTGTFGTNYLIQAASARNSGYGMRIVQSASAAGVLVGNLASKAGTFGLNVRVVSATGTPVVAVATDQAFINTHAQVLYDATNTKFGVRAGTTGTVQWQSGTTATNTWVWLDFRVRVNATTWTVDWRIETAADTYTDQTQATLSGQSATSFTIYCLQLGSGSAQTMTADYDDVVLSTYYAAYPLGPHQVRLLTVDPAGTPTVSGTTTNFSTFASNGTLTAWNATTARNALDEVPPTVSAAADGVVQTAVGASDYMQFPMADYTLGPTEFINGVRMLAPLWSGTGAGAGDLAIRGYDGTTETALATASQITPGSPTAISATVPVWRTAMWQSTNGWTQAELNACALRVGFSGDATPDMGVSALYLEVAIGQTRPGTGIGDYAAAQVDPTRLGLMSVTVTPPASTGLTLRWTDKNGSGTQYTAALGTFTQQFDSASAADVTVIEVESDPELPNRE